MKKYVLTLALAGFVAAGIATPVLACEGGKCKMEHTNKDSKAKKGKKATAKAESCHSTETTAATASAGMAGKSCCAKKDAPKTEAAKETKAQQ
ncbi:hypothetical protein [Pontibacter ruber]|uniref:Periplasmic protein n=1 Tax=Pontibacter ruber TaxID=1343895 RepID=A0ABW5CU23_9BACT|nr:hypothetical protein [Pontibacter ruber]